MEADGGGSAKGEPRERAARLGTVAVHGGGDERGGGAPHVPPIVQSSAFSYRDSRRAAAAFGERDAPVYTRIGNPTIRALERHVAELESFPVRTAEGERGPPGEVDARFFASGMAAISAVTLGVAAGGRLVCQEGIYGTTMVHARQLEGYGVRVDFAPVGDTEALRAVVEDGEPPALVWVETPANPRLQTTDLAEAARIAHDAGALLAVDGTFATPALQRPLAWGADFAVHSTTKFMSGHGVALGGVVSGAPERLERHLDPVRKNLGGAADPFAAWLTRLGLRTLDVRMVRHAAGAAALADALGAHPRVAAVHRPDPSRLPEGQLAGPGPMLSFTVEGGAEAALDLIDRLRLATLAPTLGTLDTLVQHPFTMSHRVLPESRRRALGIDPGLVRVSVGLEDPADLVADFERALSESC